MYTFRGKKCSNGEWVVGYYLDASDSWKDRHSHRSWILSKARSNGGWLSVLSRWAVDDDTVSMESSTYDADGIKIFDGDILSDNEHKSIYLVKFDGGAFCLWRIRGKESELKGWMDYAGVLCCQLLKIIGNRWDNPELLKGE